ncbi:MAG TPA: TIGR02444 family protein [Xanthobacteraceae bacterium]|jgi:uncharacterized protein (TIGR02444 family)
MTAAETASSGSPFWRFSLGFYRRAGVADACIALQEEAGVDVNLLLFLLWLASSGRQLSAAEVQALEDKVAPWRKAAVIPLRTVRRALKSPAFADDTALVPAATAELFRTRIKAVELEAERLQQEAMHELARASPPGREVGATQRAARANVEAYAAVLRVPLRQDALGTLLAALTAT